MTNTNNMDKDKEKEKEKDKKVLARSKKPVYQCTTLIGINLLHVAFFS
jgi:hypothetical protein